METPRAWSFIVLGDDRQYAGNEGYLDELGRLYRYDSHVANHKQVSRGDVAILRGHDKVLGIATILYITSKTGTKTMNRCPNCNRTSIKPRTTKLPEYRCHHCHHEFEAPVTEVAAVTLYEAHYEDSYLHTPEVISIDRLKNAVLRPSDQVSIEEISLLELEPSFLHLFPASQEMFAAFRRSAVQGARRTPS